MSGAVSVCVAGHPATVSPNTIYLVAPANSAFPNGRISFPITDPKFDLSNQANAWSQIPRPGAQLPLLRFKSLQLKVLKLTLTFDDNFSLTGSAESDLVYLQGAADAEGSPPQNGYQLVMGNLTAGFYTITDMSTTAVWLNPKTNTIKTATVTLELTEQPEFSSASTAMPLQTPGVKATPATIDPKGAPKGTPSTYTVQAGDTLYSIAQKFYNNGELWTRLADANNITNPGALAVGIVLKLK